ncbi:MAG: RNase adapter RapZ [Coriobacteriia bacterium]|nr:RNase adapter RapZ [Coriobacteriia bacterium]
MPELIVITGISGGGRTEAMHVFEDLGYFCIDNLPAVMLANTVAVEKKSKEHIKLAVVCDARNGDYFGSLRDEILKVEEMDVDYRIVFLDASDDKLIARYKSSRRRHPMCNSGETIAQGIQKERALLYSIREMAHYVIDTTNTMPQVLRTNLRTLFKADKQMEGLSITVYSFGFKNGAAYDADLVIDVRFLPNPYWDPDMRPLSGLDAPVHDFVMAREETQNFLEKWFALLDILIPGYVKEGKQQLAIAIGCTGGQHRSVTIAEITGDYLKARAYRVSIAHRDLEMAVAQASGKSGNIPKTNPGTSGAWPPINR